MSYATISDLIDRFTEAEMIDLTDTTALGVLDMAPIDRALVDADAEIDSALIGRYAIPVAPVPDLLVRIACDLARYALHADRPTDIVTERAKIARTLLSQIADGKRLLDAAPVAAQESMQGLVEIVSGRTKTPFVG